MMNERTKSLFLSIIISAGLGFFLGAGLGHIDWVFGLVAIAIFVASIYGYILAHRLDDAK